MSAPDRIAFAGGRSFVGTDRPVIKADGEGPKRPVRLASFAIEAETVTNTRFATFVAATGFRTEAERFGWSAVFRGLLPDGAMPVVAARDTPWWMRIDGACWSSPEGPGSDLAGREDHPAVQISWADAAAFADWSGGRLPTEAEWEHAARSGSDADIRFPWGDAEPDDATIHCNIWQGRFPEENTLADGWYGTAPARSFDPNPSGMFNASGNVWEWTADAYSVRSVSKAAKIRNERARSGRQRVLKGGSFLCHASYCYRYRIAARSGNDADSAASNVGFRVAYDD